ncbi:NAD(P)-dependent oxidoreductase [Alcanivorax sp. DP30]|uniref:NAD-dependent epimerase/dehydratase family protein n=1 Tax=Alcanivorax sp. DP30 TaxID=2606217 RepID=UPI0013719E78|nr:NAD(P)-dependent oxidoreductase [Alcanivorax sp. DP30]MZR64148.1 NAD-dependent epimerase/dehydratase family protein [Alcanivorax sp. DP30]
MKSVLVLGASGSLGRGIIGSLKDRYRVTATYSGNKFEEEGVDVQRVDITDPSSLEALGGEYEAVIFIAGAMPATMAGYHPQRYIDTNISGTLNVLEYCRVSGIKKVVYVMTFSDVSHKFYNGVPIKSDEERGLTYTGDHAVYAITKVAACDLIEHYHQEWGLQTIILRIPTVYCADENFNYFVDGKEKVKAYVQMIKSIVANKSVEVWGNPGNAKDMPYIKDFSRLVGLAVDNETAQGTFNAGTGAPVSLDELVDTMIEVFSPNEAVEKIYKPENASQPNFTFDMSKTNEVFGFEPEWDLKSMLEDIRDVLGIKAFRS